MPRGPLGFPRLTSIGPFVTDGGRNEYKMGDMAIIEDHEELGLNTTQKHALEIAEVRDEEIDVDIIDQTTSESEGMATVERETLERAVRLI